MTSGLSIRGTVGGRMVMVSTAVDDITQSRRQSGGITAHTVNVTMAAPAAAKPRRRWWQRSWAFAVEVAIIVAGVVAVLEFHERVSAQTPPTTNEVRANQPSTSAPQSNAQSLTVGK